MLTAGVLMILSKLEIITLLHLFSALIGIGAALAVGVPVFFLLGGSDASFARRLDSELGLNERVQTMVAYRDASGEMLELQREDTEKTLAGFSLKELRIKRIAIYIAALCVGLACLAVGIFMTKPAEEPDAAPVAPFELSAMQKAGLAELIAYVDASDMDEPYRTEIKDELIALLDGLTNAKTEPEMQAALAGSLAAITRATYDSSAMTEILDALWATDNKQIKALALALDTSDWTEAYDAYNWGDFAEKYEQFEGAFDFASLSESENPTESELKLQIEWALEDFAIKSHSALDASGISKDDILYASLARLTSADNSAAPENAFVGLEVIFGSRDGKTYGQLYDEVRNAVSCMGDEFYSVISHQKANADIGEYVLKKLALLFSVMIPEFERPTLKESTQSGGNNDDEQTGNGGGVGSGPTFGSDDLVLDPVTGKYVTYGTLYATYSAIMIEKVNDGRYAYTDEQIKAIEKYFALLYSGLEKD